MAGEWLTENASDSLPALPQGWRHEELGNLVEERGICYGIVQPGIAVAKRVPIVRVNNIRNRTIDTSDMLKVEPSIESKFKRSPLRGGEVLLTLVGTLGEVAIVPENFQGWNVARAVGVIPILKDPGNRWVAICLRSAYIQHCIRMWATSTVQATFNLRDVAKLPIPIPPKEECEAITDILDRLDDKIELNRRMNATLEAMARALFQSWFVDFDPVRRNAEGDSPRRQDSLFPDSFEDSKLGELPKGWRCIPVEDVCDINRWTLNKKDDLPTLEYVEISEVNRGDIANISNYSRGEEPSRARRRLRHGDTVLSTVRPDRGSYFLGLNPPSNRVASTGFAVLTPTKAPWSYVHAAMTQPEVLEHLGHVADGGSYPAVRPEIVGEWKVALPDNSKILEVFHRTCAPLFEKAETNRIQSRTLATLRDTLLPKLLSAEVVAGKFNKEGFEHGGFRLLANKS